MTDVQTLWNACSTKLRMQVSEAAWKTLFEPMHPLLSNEGVLVLAVPNNLTKERIEGRYLPLVRELVADAAGTDIPVQLHVRPAPLPVEAASPSNLDHADTRKTNDVAAEQSSIHIRDLDERAMPTISQEAPLNPRYTFDGFVIGASNRFAHAAARSVAETPARSYNPLFIHGDVGLGKTHLLHAIGNYVRENFVTRHVRYVSTETFMNEFVDAIRTNTTLAFKRRYRECDVLLIDDIQFMENKERLQEEFFYTFNHLYEASKQIVITSDRPPKSIATLEDRLTSRFISGLITDIQPPELETRLAILRKKAEREPRPLPDEILEFIAANVTDNTRELEGALIRVSAFASFTDQPLTQQLAEQVLSDLITANRPQYITPDIILSATAETFGFTVEELCGTSRRRPLVTARQVGMYIFRDVTDFSYPAIAREFGGRDHTTVIHAVEKISTLMKERRQIFDQVTDLIHRIKGRG